MVLFFISTYYQFQFHVQRCVLELAQYAVISYHNYVATTPVEM